MNDYLPMVVVAVLAAGAGWLLATTRSAERGKGERELELLRLAREDLSNQFRVLASDIMEEKGKNFVELNQASLTQLLSPLQGELAGFRKKVEDVYVAESKDRSALGEQLRILTELNGTLRAETVSLTKALKGDSKAQGDWGEVILDRLLDSAGLTEGIHYKRQESHRDGEGDRVIPDVVLYLPNDRQMVVDSKVTLTAYSGFAGAETAAAREAALSAHLDAVRRHIKGLSEKNYQTLYALTSLDFVVMFMPLEGAFMSAVTSDQDLFQYAWERNVLLVSPSTLLFVVRTIAHVWTQESQTRNAKEIARRGASLYDKFVGFTGDLLKVGEHLARAHESYDDARKKLSEGPGNLVRQVELLRGLGVRPTKTLAADLVAATDEEAGDADSTPLLPSA
jgi:DNA recombination protein RmuC